MLIKETIKDLRKSKGFTQEEMAKKLSCNRQKIADWERGKSTPSADDLILLSKLFKVSTDYLLGLTTTPTIDKNLQFVCDYTGLNVTSVYILQKMVGTCYHSIFEKMLDDNIFSSLAFYANDYIRCVDNQLIYLKGAVDNFEESEYCYQQLFEQYETSKDLSELNLFRIQEKTKDYIKEYCYDTNKEIKTLKEKYEKLKVGVDNGNNTKEE